jgi:hypothetical protein
MSDTQMTVIDTYQDPQGNGWYLYAGGTQVTMQWAGSSNSETISSIGPFSTAEAAYNQLALSMLPLPQDVQDFVTACNTLAAKVGEISSTATQTAATVDVAAHYVELIGDALIALVVVPGVGPGLAAAGAAIRQASIATEDIAAQVMQVGWQGLVAGADIIVVGTNAWTARSIPDGGWTYLEQIGDNVVSPIATAIREILDI